MKAHADLFKVLADEVRLKMLWLLSNHDELCVCDFVAALEITQSKASRHLRTLFHGGVVKDRKEGLWSYYSLRALESELTRPHLDLLRKTLAACPDARAVLQRLNVWLEHNRSFPKRPAPCAKTQTRRRSDRKASGCAGRNARGYERR